MSDDWKCNSRKRRPGRRPGGEVVATVAAGGALDADAVAEEVLREQEMYRAHRQARVDLINYYAETRDCRRRYLLNHFGEVIEGPCGRCEAVRWRNNNELLKPAAAAS